MKVSTGVPILGFVLFLSGCACNTFLGHGRYTLKSCDEIEIEGVTHRLEHTGGQWTLNGERSISRGINRDVLPWVYVHQETNGNIDITFDKGEKAIYPLHTGVSASIFSVFAHPWQMTRSTNAAFANEHWLVSHRWVQDGIYFDLQHRTGDVTQWQSIREDIWVPSGGTEVSVAEIDARVRVLSFDSAAPSAMVQFIPSQELRIPVVFVHGHSVSLDEVWMTSGPTAGMTSVNAALEANPQVAIDPFYLSLPLHGDDHPGNQNRSIVEDAQDILAAIEGGPDSGGIAQEGLLNRPEYQSLGRVAIVAYSQGTLSSRYYIKHLMGSRYGSPKTVSVFVSLAAPNHGISSIGLAGAFVGQPCEAPDEPDRARRQLCGGLTSTTASALASCGNCDSPLLPQPQRPTSFTSNELGDDTFITALNGHSFADNCTDAEHPQEAPHSRPTDPNGILYLNLYAENEADKQVGGAAQSGDCAGRRQAHNHAPDAINREVSGLGTVLVHTKIPHHWPTICYSLNTISNGQVPTDENTACAGLTEP